MNHGDMAADTTALQRDSGPQPDDGGTFRDRLGTIDEEGKRKWIFPKKPEGKFTRARTYVSWFLLAFLFGSPFITMNGEQLLLFNIIERKFVLFGMIFQPQDFYLFGLATLAAVVFILLFTAVFGRLFCGWICPQTVFMEMVFRKIEYWIEGDGHEQRLLDLQPWTVRKAFKKTLKLGIFFALSFVISNFFLAYIIGMDELLVIVTDPPSEHLGGLIAILLFSGAFLFVFAWFREQVCVLVCPYGRLQSVLLDENSVVISYDFDRGEPRGRLKRNVERTGLGDCVDCGQCVIVCPTGIDIRDGTQLECVNCTACIDACDAVMDKVKLPRGLIRYASYNSIKTGTKKLLTPRVIAYSSVLLLLILLLAYLFISRGAIRTTLLRAPGTLYQEKPGEVISNLYTLRIANRTGDDLPVEVTLVRPRGTLTLVVEKIFLRAGETVQSALFIEIPESELQRGNTPITVEISSGGRVLQEVRSTFVGP